MSVTVITDSAATIPRELAAELGIAVLPLHLTLGAEQYRDGEVDPQTLLDRIDEATTSGPTPMDFLAAVEGGGASSEGAVIATVAHDLSAGTQLSATAAADLAGVPIRVVDTASAAGGEGLVVLAAAQTAAAGGSIDEVAATAAMVAERVRLVATLPSLDHIARSGRVPHAAAWAARWVGLRPVIELRRGRISPYMPARSDEAAQRRLLQIWSRSIPAEPAPLHVAALHSLAPAPAQALIDAVAERVTPETAFVGSFGTAMLVHTGSGVVGLAWWWGEG
jgi:DegV family protein with EDD domain